MDGRTLLETYLLAHGFSTIGAIIIFMIRNEHRITKIETAFQILKETHDFLTLHNTTPHQK